MSNILAAAEEMMEAKEAKSKAITLEQVLKKIKEHTFSCMVAGGYCRDVFHGVAHKDIDIIVYNVYPDDHAERVLITMLWQWMFENLEVQNITATGESEYDHEGRIHFVWHLPHHNADIIFYNARTHMEVLSKFDCNLNQFYLPSTVPDFDSDKPYNPSLEESPVYVGDDAPDFLVFLKKLPEDRIEKMVAKHKAFYPDAWSGLQEPVAYHTGDYDDDCLDSFVIN